jgi:glycosyltransferase involved in cell wall biosynthesis
VSPIFTVICATYNRGRHILPTIKSVLRQEFQDFEYYIIGDFCSDDTDDIVRPYLNERVRWLNLPERGKSQSFPNNAGLKLACGNYIAYIGHDDIWAPDHLTHLHQCFVTDEHTDFAVSGCLMHGPPNSNHYRVTGIFDDDAAKFEHFFPPSSLAHKRAVVERIGYWPNPGETKAPVDADLLLRAAHAGLRFRSTGHVTAHKFTAAMRYLSYLRPASDEQQALLDLFRRGEAQGLVDHAVRNARDNGRFMSTKHEAYDTWKPGARHRVTMRSRGLEVPPLQPMGEGVTIEQTEAFAGLDWQPPRQGVRRYRMSGVNPRPKLLIPVIHSNIAEFQVEVVKVTSRAVLKDMTISLNENQVPFRVWKSSDKSLLLIFEGRLKPDDYSVLQFDLIPKDESRSVKHGRIGVASIGIRPASPLRHEPLADGRGQQK